MIVTSTINLSPTHEFVAAQDLAGEFTAVGLIEDGVVTAGASALPIGILTGGQECSIGDDVTVQLLGECLWKVGGESICAGDLLTADDGLAVKATDFALGVALESARANSVVHALLR